MRDVILRHRIQLVRSHHDVPCEAAVHSVPHSATGFAENEVTRAAVRAVAARDGGGAQDRHAVTEIHARDARAHLHDGAGALVAEDDRRIVPEGVVQDVEIGPAHPAEGDLDLHLVRSAHRLVNVQDVDVAGPGSVLDHCFHQNLVRDDDGTFLQGCATQSRPGWEA